MKKLSFFAAMLPACILQTAVCIMAACSSVDCNIEGKVQCHYAIQDSEGNDAQLAFPLTVTMMRANAGIEDSVIINMQPNVARFDMPMSYASDTDRVVLTLNIPYTVADEEGEKTLYRYTHDTLRIAKSNAPLFESVDCAPRYGHTVTDVRFSRHFIDDVVVNKAKIDNDISTYNILIRLQGSSE